MTAGPDYINPDLWSHLRAVDAVTPDPQNARMHPDNNREAIAKSLAGFRQQKPIVVGADGVVIAGNGTLLAARALGWEQIAAVTFTGTPEEARAYAVADNQTALSAEWDAEILRVVVGDLDAELRELLGFDDEGLASILGDVSIPDTNDSIDEEAMKDTENECPSCGFKW